MSASAVMDIKQAALSLAAYASQPFARSVMLFTWCIQSQQSFSAISLFAAQLALHVAESFLKK